MRPFLRWAGGKRWLTSMGRISMPKSSRYVEPFLGGGAVFFDIQPQRALLSDLNPYLINAYEAVRDNPIYVYQQLTKLFSQHSKDLYYEVRSEPMEISRDGAVRFIYLNRCCFNGLFRVSLSGKFNVPIGTKAFELKSEEEFVQWSEALHKARIEQGDFERIIDACGAGDFLFLDPPYTVNHNSNGFIEYNEKIFSWDDQVRLVRALERSCMRGVKFVLTNADHEAVRDLYSQFDSEPIERGSEMSGKKDYRRQTTELFVTNLV